MQLAYQKPHKEKKNSKAEALAQVLLEKWNTRDEANADKEIETIKKRLMSSDASQSNEQSPLL